MKIGFVSDNKLIKKIKLEIGSQFSVMIGRSSQCDVVIPANNVSGLHVQLICDESGRLFLVDQQSTNGTYVNQIKITPGSPHPIQSTDNISLGKSSSIRMVFNPDDYVTGIISSPGNNDFNDTKANTNIESKLREKSVVYIGRDVSADVVIDHPTISRRHAMIEKSGTDTYVIKDLGSTNGTFLNGVRITAPMTFTNADTIFVGRFKLTLSGTAKDLSKEIAIRAVQIEKRFDNNKIGLHQVSFNIPSKILTAVMGPSGCGKSTLLKTLNGSAPPTSGLVYLCGLELTRNFEYLKTQIGYVPQDDIVHHQLTVEQSLHFAAKLRLQNATQQQIDEKIEQVLENLKISHIRHNLVGNISGGQRKRVSIAVEILNDPLILFLDEPTSPLDPQTIEEFLSSLRVLCEKMGTTVIIVTHKPEDLNYVDRVIFMAEGGHMAFHGDNKSYLGYFGCTDVVKVYSKLAGDNADPWISKFKANNYAESEAVESAPLKQQQSRINYFSQYWWLTMRYFKIKFNDKVNTSIMIAQAPIIALLVVMIFQHIEISVPFLLTISAVWFGTNNAAREIVGELPIYLRERMFNQGILPYLFSKLTVLSFFAGIQSLLFSIIIAVAYSSEGNNAVSWAHPEYTIVWMFLITLTSSIFGLMVSALVNSTEKVMSIVPIVLIPQILLSGIMAKLSNGFSELLSYLTISRWGNEGFCLIQKNIMSPKPQYDSVAQKFNNVDTVFKASEILNEKFHPNIYKDIFGGMHGTIRLDFICLAVLAFMFFLITIIALKQKDSIK